MGQSSTQSKVILDSKLSDGTESSTQSKVIFDGNFVMGHSSTQSKVIFDGNFVMGQRLVHRARLSLMATL